MYEDKAAVDVRGQGVPSRAAVMYERPRRDVRGQGVMYEAKA